MSAPQKCIHTATPAAWVHEALQTLHSFICVQPAASVRDTPHEMCCVQLEFKLRDALRENATASREVKSMRASLKSLQLSKLRQPSRGTRQPNEPVGNTPGIPCFGEDDSMHAQCNCLLPCLHSPPGLLAYAKTVPEILRKLPPQLQSRL